MAAGFDGGAGGEDQLSVEGGCEMMVGRFPSMTPMDRKYLVRVS